MRFEPTPLTGAHVVELELHADERGFFAREWCEEEFGARGLATRMVQGNLSCNRRRGTLRGMHYQASPHEEAKLVRCRRGAIYDVIVDLRRGSASRLDWFGVELSAENRRALYVPEGFAHGYLTLADDSEVSYLVSAPYHPAAERGIRYNDPAVDIAWPEIPIVSVSEKDRSWDLIDGR